MIEDKEMGIKVAENKVEAFWTEMKTKVEKDIEMNEHNIEIGKHILKLAEQRLKEKAWSK